MTENNEHQESGVNEAAELNELMQVRREKMAAIAAQDIEPFGRKYDVTHHATEIIEKFESMTFFV